MLPTLEKSERFSKEFRNFKERISNITNEKLKSELNDKLTQLLREVRSIDEQHNDMFMRKQLPSMIPESRTKLAEIRQFILKRLEEWEKSR